MVKRLVDIDEEAFAAAQAELGTTTIEDTVNESLRRVGSTRSRAVSTALDRLSHRQLPRRKDAWR
jgi:Arc/MetJ family transcription regulator